MSEKIINTRLINKHDTEANWAKATTFVPKQGELIVYDVDSKYTYERFKIGDGTTLVNDLPFAVVQSDWFEGDSKSPAYIKNRPFGHALYYVTKELTAEQEVTGSGYLTNVTGKDSTLHEPYSDGNTVKVYFDDEVYECTVVIDDYGYYTLVSDTELPFTAKESITESTGSVKFTATDGGTHTVRLTHLDMKRSTLPEEYLPENVVEVANMIYIGDTEPTDERVKIWINTAEDGTGVIPLLPRIATVTLLASAWEGSSNPYSQVVEIDGLLVNDRPDLLPTAQQIVELQNEDISLMASNDNAVLTVYALGGKPSVDLTMQIQLTTVAFI